MHAPLETAHFGLLHAVKFSLKLLTKRQRLHFVLVTFTQMLLALLDLAGVLLMGVVAALAVALSNGDPVNTLDLPLIGHPQVVDTFTPVQTMIILVGTACAFFILKSLLSATLIRHQYIFLASCQQCLSRRLALSIFHSRLETVQSKRPQELAYGVIDGAYHCVMGLLGSFANAAVECTILILMGATLLLIDPVTALGAAAYFAIIGIVLHRILGSWSGRVSEKAASEQIAGLHLMQRGVIGFREVQTLGKTPEFVDEVFSCVVDGSRARADLNFISVLPKFSYESALVVGALGLTWWTLTSSPGAAGIVTLVVFLAAGSRILPSLLRFQTALITMKNSTGAALPFFELTHEFQELNQPPERQSDHEQSEHGSAIEVSIENLSFRYRASCGDAIQNLNLTIAPGQTVAFVGPSGAGKSTLADLILGLLEPTSGSVKLSGIDPHTLLHVYPGTVAYLPQVVTILDGTIASNILFGSIDADVVERERIWECLRSVGLVDFVSKLPLGLDTPVGDRGTSLSGGQRQRLGLARCLFARPKLLVLDEATSALDADSEQIVADTLKIVSDETTLVVIAHRLASVRYADLVCYFEEGSMIGSGTFEQVRHQVPEFNRQAKLMGL